MKDNRYRFLFAGGGTGGHLFPAIAVAQQIKKMKPEADILFIGTRSKIEGTVVPSLGFEFRSIWIKGFARKLNFENFLFPLKLVISVIQSVFINMKFKPMVAVGSGGYVSGPAVFGASIMGARIILLEQNSYPGVTTRLLERYAREIHVMFDDSVKYLRQKDKVHISGNPVRENLGSMTNDKAVELFGLNPSKKTVLVLGGSLGAASINNAVADNVRTLSDSGVQLIWQTGKNYYNKYKNLASESVYISAFIDDMNAAYSACNIVIARAGATTISEILALGLVSILVPSPNVAGNHQYHNARSLAAKNAAIMLEDALIADELINKVNELFNNSDMFEKIKRNAAALGKPEAAKVIAERAISMAEAI